MFHIKRLNTSFFKYFNIYRSMCSSSSSSFSSPLSKDYIKQFESMMKQRFFYYPSAHLYGSSSGLYDLGPHSTSIKWKLLEFWKNEFINKDDNIYPIESSVISPEKVLQASGHVDKFQDILVKDTITSEYIRVDHLINDYLTKNKDNKDKNKDKYKNISMNEIYESISSCNIKKIKDILHDFKLTKNPNTGNLLSDPIEFNLMFQTKLGVEGSRNAFLRPELAQGIFTNFIHILRQTDGNLPFGVASIGNVYRNETSARQGLLRTREFTLAELEYFFNPNIPFHPNISFSNNIKLPILSTINQESNNNTIEYLSIKDLKDKNIITNDIILYYLEKSYSFLINCGINSKKIRFRQHLSNEMAHYACDCWDIEIETLLYGWIECVGIANRTNYDLSKHIEKSQKDNQLMVFVPFEDGKSYKENSYQIKPKQPLFGKTFKQDASNIIGYLSQLSISNIQEIKNRIMNEECLIQINSKQYKITKDLVEFNEIQVTKTGNHIIPHVIEPSFGINRILYCIFEHTYRIRSNDTNRGYLSLPSYLAPIPCEIVSMKKNNKYINIQNYISNILKQNNIQCNKDLKSKSIGKRYSIIDEIGTPFIITIDDITENEYDLLNDKATITIRFRDTMKQIRKPINLLPQIIKEYLNK